MISPTELAAATGLTEQEARTYLALHRLGETRTGPLCDKAEVPSSRIYAILDRLLKKGLVSYRLLNNTRIYAAAPPSAIGELIEGRRERLEQEKRRVVPLIARMEVEAPRESTQSTHKYFEGVNGVKSLWEELAGLIRPGQTLLVHAGRRESYTKLDSFYREWHVGRIAKRIRARMIFPADDRRIAPHRSRMALTEVRTIPLNTLGEWTVIGDLVILQHLSSDQPRAFLINDREFAGMMRENFERAWSMAKPIGRGKDR